MNNIQLNLAPNATEVTYRNERIRAVAAGILETSSVTFLLLIAVRYFDAGPASKALLATATSVGLLLSPLVVQAVHSSRTPATGAAAFFALLSAAGYFATVLVDDLTIFILGGLLGVASLSMTVPLITHMYQENYPAGNRGRLFSRTAMIRIAVAAGFSYLAGRALDGRIEYYQLLMIAFSICSLVFYLCLSRTPSTRIVAGSTRNPFAGMRFIKTDRVFRQTLICWMLMGFANLMMLPLRVEFLANSDYGLNLTVGDIALLTGVIPNLARFVMSPVWGTLFDKVNFFVLRIAVNLGFAVGIFSFFTSNSYGGLVLGAVLFGASNAGGDIAWALWVTKFAPADRVAEYMAVHTFFTGVRGILAPFVGFYMIQYLGLGALGFISAGMILLGSAILVPEYRYERERRKT